LTVAKLPSTPAPILARAYQTLFMVGVVEKMNRKLFGRREHLSSITTRIWPNYMGEWSLAAHLGAEKSQGAARDLPHFLTYDDAGFV
jgi:hypothetical protein